MTSSFINPVDHNTPLTLTISDKNASISWSVLLATLHVRILLTSAKTTPAVRALADNGSQVNLITSDCVQRLHLKFVPQVAFVSGIGENMPFKSPGYIDATIQHRQSSQPTITARFVVVPKITSRLPTTELYSLFDEELASRDLADPQYWIPAKIDMLLGAGIWTNIVTGEILRKTKDENITMAQKTIFGWVIFSNPASTDSSSSLSLHICSTSGDVMDTLARLDETIQRFWKIEAIPKIQRRTAEEQLAEDTFASTHQREASGRYCVKIPFRTDLPALGHSKQTALKRLLHQEERLRKDPSKAKKYEEFMMDYITSGHMRLAPEAPADCKQVYYIPHHAIMKKKFRIVFDASCATSTGISLNDMQLPGEKLQDDLCKILIRFRLNKFAITADIVKMFRQVNVDPSHWNFQRILWRPEPDGPIREYYITVVVWGTTSATFNAVRALRQCAIDGAGSFPLASQAALRDFYVDDLLSGANDATTLQALHTQMQHMTASGGFHLNKWTTNESVLAAKLNQHPQAEVDLDDDTGVLGMIWNPERDVIKLKVITDSLSTPDRPSKADIVSAISKVYDPSGLFGPTILIGKLIMQDFWREENLGWKDEAPVHLVQRWHDYHKQINDLATITITRWIGDEEWADEDLIQWHIFSDASEKAYGAAAYLRIEKPTGLVIARLITSKSRVAPIKQQSIPRLELFGALLGTRLLTYLREAIGHDDWPVFLWTDSSIVLHWINKADTQMSEFIGTRITEILTVSRPGEWRHVKSGDNPADILSRGMIASRLESEELWWKGPIWLRQKYINWPPQPRLVLSPTERDIDAKETKSKGGKAKQVCLAAVNQPTDPSTDEFSVRNKEGVLISLLERRSTLNGILNVTAYVMRFINCIRKCIKKEIKRPNQLAAKPPCLTPITVKEKEASLLIWVRLLQRIAFPKEIAILADNSIKKKKLPNKSKLLQLTPFWRENDSTIRLSGRLDHSFFSEDEKHPLILPADHKFVRRLVANTHLKTLHGGTQLCVSVLRQRFWILNIRQLIKSVRKQCAECKRFSKETAQQMMGSLPSVRVTPAPPFSRVGVDFAGPFAMRKNQATAMALRKAATSIPNEPTTIKGWVVVFVCLVTRAVHLDVVRGLNVEAFLDCFARFIARRGPCEEIWSDNGTTFVGADNELKRVLQSWDNLLPHQQLANMGVTWKFITPAAPFEGGIWEAGVKTFKYHLRRVIGRRILTADQLYTLVVQIEACMNARPLFRASDDPSDLNPITPAHLVIGRSTLQQPLTDNVIDMPDNRLTVWGFQQKMFQQFWKSWKDDYIISLQKRNKWYNREQNLKPGDMVLIQHENTPPSKWPLGLIRSVSKAPDGLVRSAIIEVPAIKIDNKTKKKKMSTTTLERSVRKLTIMLTDEIAPQTTSSPRDAVADPGFCHTNSS